VTRTLVARVADWPVVAAGVSLDEPAAVFFANRAVAVSPAARAEGVTVDMRRREAQARCPDLVVLQHDPARDARAFEPLVAAIEPLTPRVEVGPPGRCAFPTRGPARYFGGDEPLAARARSLVHDVLGDRAPVQVGIADGPFAAELAAHDDLVVPAGASAAFLAPQPLSTLNRPELVDVLHRLGLRTLGDLAALPAADVLARFGTDGATAHRLASGRDERPPATRRPSPELAVQAELDPPAERVDAAAFLARALADELHSRLAARGQACTRVLIAVETEHGEVHERLWRHEGALTAGAIADRARWQLDGWLNGSSPHRPTAGITLLRLAPDEVVAASGRQLGFWGGVAGADERVLRALARLEALLGPESVTVPEWRGGRGPTEQVERVPAGAVDLTSARPAADPAWRQEPWPGRLPPPSPATVATSPIAIDVVDERGAPVRVSGRGALSAAPARLAITNRAPSAAAWATITAWAGPWPVEERWWDERRAKRRARFQVLTDDGTARLVMLEGGRWWLEALYD
jgi:protein ImuB